MVKTLLEPCPTVLHTARMDLELLQMTDPEIDFCLSVVCSPEFIAFVGDHTLKTRDKFHKKMQNDAVACVNPDGSEIPAKIAFLGRLRDGGERVGIFSMAQRKGPVPPDLGWAVAPKFWRQGYATEGAMAFKECVVKLGFDEIMAWPGAHNRPSIQVAEKIGLVPGAVIERDTGEKAMAYVLPGMKIAEGITLSLNGFSDVVKPSA